MEAFVQTKEGKREPTTMGSFGLGLGRIMAGVVEVSNDKHGIIWPRSLAPYRLCVIADKSSQAIEKARWLCQEIEVCLSRLVCVIKFPFPDFLIRNATFRNSGGRWSSTTVTKLWAPSSRTRF